MKNWYVAHSKPRSEEFLWRQFCLREIDSYYPCIEIQPVNPRSRKVQPYFPGYLFVHVDLGVIGQSAIQWMPGAVGLVRFGDEPATVSEGLITAIKQRIANLKTAVDDGLILFRKGDRVKVEEGVFRGYEGIFDVGLSGTERVRILLSLLTHRQVAMELPASCLRLVD